MKRKCHYTNHVFTDERLQINEIVKIGCTNIIENGIILHIFLMNQLISFG